jgi:DNA (cytosine-5)-methyltransferase 1
MKILNLYACLGGNRFKWEEINPDIEVTAVELDPDLCELYKIRFPNDQVICADAHQFLLDHYQEFEFIWSSPPCPTHSRSRFWAHGKKSPVYPDFTLYEEIIFLQHYFNGKYCVENVVPFYDPLINGSIRGRHIYWSNFFIPRNIGRKFENFGLIENELKNLSNFHLFDFNLYNGEQRKLKIARNLVDYEAGKEIFAAAFNIINKKETKQTNLIFEV